MLTSRCIKGKVGFEAPPGWDGRRAGDGSSGATESGEAAARRARRKEYEQMKRETMAETAAGEALGAKSEAVAKKPRQRTLAAAGNRPSTNPSRGKSSVQDAGGKTGDARAVATQRRRGADVQARRERAGLQPRASLATNPRRRGPAPRRPFGTNSVRSLTRSGTGLMVSDHFLFGSIGSGGVYKLSEGGAVASKIKPSYRGVIINGGYGFK